MSEACKNIYDTLPNLKDMQRAFWINHELKRKPYFGFDQREELPDSEDEQLEKEAKQIPQMDEIVPDKQMLIKLK